MTKREARFYAVAALQRLGGGARGGGTWPPSLKFQQALARSLRFKFALVFQFEPGALNSSLLARSLRFKFAPVFQFEPGALNSSLEA
jgi:hypothetical protein